MQQAAIKCETPRGAVTFTVIKRFERTTIQKVMLVQCSLKSWFCNKLADHGGRRGYVAQALTKWRHSVASSGAPSDDAPRIVPPHPHGNQNRKCFACIFRHRISLLATIARTHSGLAVYMSKFAGLLNVFYNPGRTKKNVKMNSCLQIDVIRNGDIVCP